MMPGMPLNNLAFRAPGWGGPSAPPAAGVPTAYGGTPVQPAPGFVGSTGAPGAPMPGAGTQFMPGANGGPVAPVPGGPVSGGPGMPGGWNGQPDPRMMPLQMQGGMPGGMPPLNNLAARFGMMQSA